MGGGSLVRTLRDVVISDKSYSAMKSDRQLKGPALKKRMRSDSPSDLAI